MNSNSELEMSSEARPNIGVRVPAKTKLEMSQEAIKAGMKLGEYAECILLNRINIAEELAKVKGLLSAERQRSEAREQSPMSNADPVKSHEVAQVAALLKDPRLMELFASLRGKKDEIPAGGGKIISIKYDTPADLLKAMIYSHKLKKQ